ncbi:MAG: LD-carboxypeptidase [Lachnospiraceae bacterium]|nr:LD-carboxypeptidase [Lachnospiraceae bacterium]
MRYPKNLPDNGRIGFVAPSFGAGSEPYITRINTAFENFEELGYKNVIGPNVYADSGIGKSNTAEKCAEEINDFFINDKCDIILSAGGGETMCEDLDYVDFKAISQARPIWYMGYSDNTNLTMLLPTLCDTAAVYSSCAGSFFEKPWHKSQQDAFDLIRGKKLEFTNYDKWELTESMEAETNPLAGINATEDFKLSVFNNGELYRDVDAVNLTAEGRLLGGCLDVMAVLVGTKYDKVREFNKKYEKDGVLWFIEACDLNVFSMRRALWQMGNAGWFDTAKGFLVGRPMHYDEPIMGLDRFKAVTDMLEKYNVPIIFDLDIGHLPPRMPMLTGAMAKATVSGNSFKIKYELV